MTGIFLALPIGVTLWLAIIAIGIGSPLLFAVGVCIIGIILCGAALIAGALSAERWFSTDGEPE